MSVKAECTRHAGFPFDRSEARTAYTVRCMHTGNRFVVEIHSLNSDFCATDYVEDLPDGDLIIEDGGHGDWDDLTSKMLAGRAPKA